MALLAIVAVALAGCAGASARRTAGYCTPAGVRTTPTAGVGGLVGAVNALPAAGACRALPAPGSPLRGGPTSSEEARPAS